MKCNYYQQKKKNRTSVSDKKQLRGLINKSLTTLFSKGYEEFKEEFKNENTK